MTTPAARVAKNEIVTLRLDEVSLVDAGDNDGATVEIVKGRVSDGFTRSARWMLSRHVVEKVTATADSLRDAITSINNDDTIFDKRAAADAAVAEALAMVGEFLPQMVVAKSRVGGGADVSSPVPVDEVVRIFEESVMDIEEITKALDDAEKSVEKAQADLAAEKARADAAEAALAKAKGGGTDDGDGDSDDVDEAVLKALPPKLRARLERLEKATADAEARAKIDAEKIAKMQAQRDDEEAIAKARADGMPDPEKTGPMLRRIAKGASTADDAAAIVAMVKAGRDKIVPLFKAHGQTAPANADAVDAESRINAAVADLRKAKPALTEAAAMAEVIEANPDLYAEFTVQKRRAAKLA